VRRAVDPPGCRGHRAVRRHPDGRHRSRRRRRRGRGARCRCRAADRGSVLDPAVAEAWMPAPASDASPSSNRDSAACASRGVCATPRPATCSQMPRAKPRPRARPIRRRSWAPTAYRSGAGDAPCPAGARAGRGRRRRALLRRAAADRARVGSAPHRHAGPRLRRPRQQRDRDRARPSRLRRPHLAATAPAEHELALPLRRLRRVHRAARRAQPRPVARHRHPRQQRVGGRGPRPHARPGRDRRRDVIAVRESYHGWTSAADAVSTSAFDNPHAADSRPDWVHRRRPERLPRPSPRTGCRGRLRARGRRPRALPGRRGPPGRRLHLRAGARQRRWRHPAGRLSHGRRRRRARARRPGDRRRGAGRLRAPGILVLGEHDAGARARHRLGGEGGGQRLPLGAVITRREIVDALAREGTFFSSAGGAPASAVAGSAILDIIDAEGLQQNAARVGAIIAEGCGR
jgi:hypothetical protein